MFPTDILPTYLAVALLVVVSPRPDNVFAASLSSIKRVFTTGLLSNVLNPKPGLFVIAFIPQFTSPLRGPVYLQMLVYGAIFAVMTVVIFTLLGVFSAKLSSWLSLRPKAIRVANVGAGLAFIGAGISILALQRRT